VETRYLPHDSLKTKYHLQLAYYFEGKSSKSPSPNRMSRKAQELPYHLLQAQEYYRLQRCISDIDIFLQLFFCKSKFYLKRLWLAFGDRYDVSACYEESLQKYILSDDPTPAQLLSVLLPLAKFVREMLQYDGSARLLARALALASEIDPGGLTTAKILYRTAQLYWGQGKWDIAEKYCVESLKIREKILGPHDLQVAKCLCGMGEVFVTRDPAKAEPWLLRSLEIRERAFGRNHHLVSRLLHDIGLVEMDKGNLEEAIKLHTEAIQIRETTLGPDNHQLAVSWETLGTALKVGQRFREAEAAMLKALRINIEVHGETHPSAASCYEWLAMIKKDLGEDAMGDAYHVKSHRIAEELIKTGVTSLGDRVVD